MSPAKGQTKPVGHRARLRLYFNVNPGWHALPDVAAALCSEYLPVANEAARMARRGELDRHYTPVEGQKRPDVRYAVPGTPPPTTED